MVPYGFFAAGAGGNPPIACIAKHKHKLGCDWFDLIAALQKQVDEHFSLTWGMRCTLVTVDDFIPKHWALVFTDNADVANALGYHDVTPDGLPLGHVFVQTSALSGEQPSVTASHELLEMLGNPTVDQTVQRGRYLYAYESADAVQRSTYEVNGVEVSNFVTPAWFGKPGANKLDHLGVVQHPFQILSGGYMPVFDRGANRWTQIFGSQAAAAAYSPAAHPRTNRILTNAEPARSKTSEEVPR